MHIQTPSSQDAYNPNQASLQQQVGAAAYQIGKYFLVHLHLPV